MPDLPDPRGGTGAAAVAGRIVSVGGESPPGTNRTVWALRPGARAWTALPDLPTPRHGLGVVSLRGRVWAIGGGPQPGLTVSGAVESLPVPRPRSSAAKRGDRELDVVLGVVGVEREPRVARTHGRANTCRREPVGGAFRFDGDDRAVRRLETHRVPKLVASRTSCPLISSTPSPRSTSSGGAPTQENQAGEMSNRRAVFGEPQRRAVVPVR